MAEHEQTEIIITITIYKGADVVFDNVEDLQSGIAFLWEKVASISVPGPRMADMQAVATDEKDPAAAVMLTRKLGRSRVR